VAYSKHPKWFTFSWSSSLSNLIDPLLQGRRKVLPKPSNVKRPRISEEVNQQRTWHLEATGDTYYSCRCICVRMKRSSY